MKNVKTSPSALLHSAVVILGLSIATLFGIDAALTTARAADAADNATAEGGGLAEIVVTARRRSETLQTEPLSITAITGVMLDAMNVRRLDDLTNLPNVNINTQQGFFAATTISIRGISQTDPILSFGSAGGALHQRRAHRPLAGIICRI